MIERKKDKWSTAHYNRWLWEKYPGHMSLLTEDNPMDSPHTTWTKQNKVFENYKGWNRRKGEQDG